AIPVGQALQRRKEYVIELETLRAMDRHHLHRIGRRGAWLRKQVRDDRIDVLRPAPFATRDEVPYGCKESPGVSQILLRIRVCATETQPHGLEPFGEGHAFARAQCF